jgi:cell division protein FtsQ
VLNVSLWTLAIAGLWISFSFVGKQGNNMPVSGLNITIHNNEENQFINEDNVKEFLDQRGDKIVKEKFSNVSIPTIEKALNSHPAIENAEVAADVNGEMIINVKQRTPVCRVINLDGESYYIDSQSKLMPLSDNFTARVLVVSGNITEPYSRRYQYSINEIKKNPIFSEVSMLDDVLEVVNYINSDTTLTSLIHQVYVNEDKEFELFPAVGQQRIILGSCDNLDLKFNKLKLFYTQGLNKKDAWQKYSTISIKYKNLVICTKK